jgi:hypothetical protein
MKTFNSRILKLINDIEFRLRLLIRFFDKSDNSILVLKLDQLDTVNFDSICLHTWGGDLYLYRGNYNYSLLNSDMDIENLCAIVDRYTDEAVKQGLVLDEEND